MSKKLSDSDKTLFRETVKGVKPLKIDTIQPQTHQPKIRIRRETEKQIDYRPLSDHYPEEVGREEKIEFMQPSIQPKYFRELKLEKFPIEARLDLHGLNSDSAREQLQQFLQSSLEQQLRVIHIIHGKGQRGTSEIPLLKNLVITWLKQYPEVLAFCSCQPRDGGTGALYILLRRETSPPP